MTNDENAIIVRDSPGAEPSAITSPARTDELIVRMWLAGKAVATQKNYSADADRLFKFAGKPLARMTLEDLQNFAAQLQAFGLAPGSRKRILAAVKSLFSFSAEIRHLAHNVAAAIRLPRGRNTRGERNLSEPQVGQMIAAADAGRNRLIVEMLYLIGLRAEELTALRWRDARPSSDGAAILAIYGKAQKTRHVRIEPATWAPLDSWRGGAGEDDPIFVSRNGGPLSTVSIWRIVSAAARKAGFSASPHWLRHSHATHAIDHGCDLRVLQQSLGHESIETTEIYVHTRPSQSSGAFLPRRDPPINGGE